MRNPNRIDSILNKIKIIWKKYPDLRLGQLFSNTLNFLALYNVEDEQLVDILSKYYKVDLTTIELEKTEDTLVSNMKNVGALNKGKIYIHKNTDVKLVSKEDLDKYLSLGYVLGRKDK